jgi:hypothetical protein
MAIRCLCCGPLTGFAQLLRSGCFVLRPLQHGDATTADDFDVVTKAARGRLVVDLRRGGEAHFRPECADQAKDDDEDKDKLLIIDAPHA